VLLRVMKVYSQSYIMDVHLELFREYQYMTLNIMILWLTKFIMWFHLILTCH
jgi:hypothetical protein